MGKHPKRDSQHVRPGAQAKPSRRDMTARDLLNSGLVGLWETRDDLGEGTSFARRLREKTQR
jgi:hypothetical protein